MKTILIPESPGGNSYISSLIEAYQKAGCTVLCGGANFYFSGFVPDVLHIQWPESLFRMGVASCLDKDPQEALIERLNWYRSCGVKIVYTVHNLCPHEVGVGELEIYHKIISISDIIVHHGHVSIDALRSQYEVASFDNHIVCPHGDYLKDYRLIPRDAARRELGIPQDKFVLLNLGKRRAYKGHKFLNQLFGCVPISNKYLIVAGEIYPSRFGSLKNRMRKIVDKVLMNRMSVLRGLSRYELQLMLSASDVMLLTHERGVTTGLIPLAATFFRPVVFPDIGNFKEQAEHWEGFPYKASCIASGVDAILACREKLQSGIMDNRKWMKLNSWDEHVGRILNELNS